MRTTSLCCGAVWLLLITAAPALAIDRFVAPNGSGNGTSTAPFGRIQDAINAAQPGDVVVIAPGIYNEIITSVRNGTAQLPITVRARDGRGTVTVTSSGRVLGVGHTDFIVDGLVLDGQFGADDLVRVGSGSTRFKLRNTEVRRTSRDAVDIGAASDVLIDGSLIHDALNATNGRTDAHGVVAGAARRLTIRNTEIHTFSGDAFQIDPSRSSPGWSDIVIEGCRFWLQPLPAASNGFAAGVVPGENAVDTKASESLARAKLTIRNSEFYGFRAGLISNMAALNIKENVDTVIDGVTIHSSEIAFRLRAPATVRVQNAVVHTVTYGVRYEDNIQGLRFWNSTFGVSVKRAFYQASSSGSVLDVRNVALLGTSLPVEAVGPWNLAVAASAFVDVTKHDYQLAATSPAIDYGIAIPEVTTDRLGKTRPQGTGYDVGAYEKAAGSTTPTPTPTPDPVPAPNPDPTTNGEIVLHAWRAQAVGNWQVVSDPSAAGGARMTSIDLQAIPLSSSKALEKPVDYFEMTFNAEAGRAYRLWVRGIAAANSATNDSVFVQFTNSQIEGGIAMYRIGSKSGAIVNLEDCTGCGLQGWGWQDNGSGANVMGPVISFATSGPQTVRVQTREDGFSIDQIVLSPAAYLTTSPGLLKGDTRILPETVR